MTEITPLLERNAEFATTGAHEGLSPIPNHQVFVITCMDGRIDPAHILGVGLGDAIVFRNAGGRATDDAIREVAFVGHLMTMMFGDEAPTFEVAILHHTNCGTGFLADPGFRDGFAERTGVPAAELEADAVVDPHSTVRADVEKLRASPMLPANAVVSGHVYDVETGRITTIDPAG